MNNQNELTKELATLLISVANIAQGIRMNTPYCPASKDDPDAPYKAMELADGLHNLGQLGKAILDNNKEEIIRNCEWHINIYEGLLEEKYFTTYLHGARQGLENAIKVFETIKRKVEKGSNYEC